MLVDFVKPEPGKTVQIHPICHESGESKGVLLVAYEITLDIISIHRLAKRFTPISQCCSQVSPLFIP